MNNALPRKTDGPSHLLEKDVDEETRETVRERNKRTREKKILAKMLEKERVVKLEEDIRILKCVIQEANDRCLPPVRLTRNAQLEYLQKIQNSPEHCLLEKRIGQLKGLHKKIAVREMKMGRKRAKKKATSETIKLRGRFFKCRTGGFVSAEKRRILFEKYAKKSKNKAKESMKDHIQPRQHPKRPPPKVAILQNVLKSVPYSGGKSERLLKRQIRSVISQGLFDPSMINQNASWWKKYLKTVKANRLGKQHPLRKKFKSIDQRYAKCRLHKLKCELRQHPKRCWPHRNDTRSLSLEKMNAEGIEKHIEKNTKQFEKIKYLFEGHFGKTCSLYGWSVKNLLILLEQLESNFCLHVKIKDFIHEINLYWAKRNRELKKRNKSLRRMGKTRRDFVPLKVQDVWKALRTSIGRPSLQQSLDYTKVYLAERCPKPHLRRLTMQNEALPKEIDGPSHLLEKYVSEATGEPSVVPGLYYYKTVFPYYKWLYDIKGFEARKDFYLKVADFFLKHQEMYPIKDKELLEPVLPQSLLSFQR